MGVEFHKIIHVDDAADAVVTTESAFFQGGCGASQYMYKVDFSWSIESRTGNDAGGMRWRGRRQ